jgi:regulator of nucleoside diphosphate kinase
MKPVISELDYDQLGQIVEKSKTQEVNFLKQLLMKLRIVKETEVTAKTVRLNSFVWVWNSLLEKIVKLQIVLPGKEDLKKMHVSVLAPISLALLGYKENDTLTISTEGLVKQLKIIKVTNK